MGNNILFSFASKFSSAIFNFFLAITLSQYLGIEGKGICSQFIAIITFIQLFCDLIGGPSLVVLAKNHSAKSLFIISLLSNFVLSFIASLSLKLTTLPSSENFIFLIFLSFLNAQVSSHQHILTGKEKYNAVSILNLLQSLMILSFTFLFLRLDNKSEFNDYQIALLISFSVIFILGTIKVFRSDASHVEINLLSIARDSFYLGIKNQIGSILQVVNSRLSYVLLTPIGLGIFSNAISITESIWIIAYSFSAILFGKIANENSTKMSIDMTLLYFRWTIFLSTIASIMLLILPDQFYTWIFGSGFVGVSNIIVYLIPGVISFAGFVIIGHYFSGRGDFNKNTIAIAVGLLTTSAGWIYFKFSANAITPNVIAALSSLSNLFSCITILFLFHKETKQDFKKYLLSLSDLSVLKKI